jgi:hypothetical protein
MAIPIFLLNKNLANDSLTLVTGTCYRAGRYHFLTSREFPAYKSKDLLKATKRKQNKIIDSYINLLIQKMLLHSVPFDGHVPANQSTVVTGRNQPNKIIC